MGESENTNGDAGVGYRTRDGTFHARCDWQDPDPVSSTVVHAVAVASGEEPSEIETLYERVDPDALNDIFKPRPGAPLRRGGSCLTFTLNGCSVTVYWDGRVLVDPPSEDR